MCTNATFYTHGERWFQCDEAPKLLIFFHRPHPQPDKKRHSQISPAVSQRGRRSAWIITMLNYKGYSGHVRFDDEVRLFHGEVLDTRDVITFQGRSVGEIEQAFRASIDDYLDFWSERGEAPEKPFSGRLMLRLPKRL